MSRPGEATLRLLLAPIAGALSDSVGHRDRGQPTRRGRHRARRRLDLASRANVVLRTARRDRHAVCRACRSRMWGRSIPCAARSCPDGQRVQICRPPAVAAGTISLTIRQPSAFAPTIGSLAAGGLFTSTHGARHPPRSDRRRTHRPCTVQATGRDFSRWPCGPRRR